MTQSRILSSSTKNMPKSSGALNFEFLVSLRDECLHIRGGGTQQGRQRHLLPVKRPFESVGRQQLDHQIDAVVEPMAAEVDAFEPFMDCRWQTGRLPAEIGQAP